MNESVYAAHHSASHRAAQLARENELLRSHAERYAATGRPPRTSWLVILKTRLSLTTRLTRAPRVAPRAANAIVTATTTPSAP